MRKKFRKTGQFSHPSLPEGFLSVHACQPGFISDYLLQEKELVSKQQQKSAQNERGVLHGVGLGSNFFE